jgi:hypothetical protein
MTKRLFCTQCKRWRDRKWFYPSVIRNHARGWVTSWCKDCARKRLFEKYQLRREKGVCYCGRPRVKGFAYCYSCRKSNKRSRSPEEVRRRRGIIKAEVFSAYGDRCACCGEAQKEFLSIDHVNGRGAQHRRRCRLRSGDQTYSWLRRRKYPRGYQLLCYNCNMAKHHCGQCPHTVGHN